MWIPPHSHTLTPRLKILHPLLLSHAPTASCGKGYSGRLETQGSISLQQPKPDLRQRAPQLNPVSSPPNRPFPFCAGHDREASPGLSEEEICSLLGQKSVVPSSRRWPMPGFLRKSVLSSLTALLLLLWRDFQCGVFQASLTHPLIPKHSASVHTPHFRVFSKDWRFPVGVSGVIPMVTDLQAKRVHQKKKNHNQTNHPPTNPNPTPQTPTFGR